MEILKVIQGVEVRRLEQGENESQCRSYEIYDKDAPYDADVVLPAPVACKVALEILKDIFLGNGKPCFAAEALQRLEVLLPRVEADPGNWWNQVPDVTDRVFGPAGPDGGDGGNYPRTD